MIGVSTRNKKKDRGTKSTVEVSDSEKYFFEGICEGRIIHNKKGINGFGYDPVFIPNGSDLTFAEMTMEEKSLFSHRAKAVKKLAGFLKHYRGDR